MPQANYKKGESFRVQFVWRIPEGDFIRAVFEAEVLHRDPVSDKYVLRLSKFLAGRQESQDGKMRTAEEVSRDWWGLVARLTDRRISLAFEADDGRPLWLRLETLTGEHDFFTRLMAIR